MTVKADNLNDVCLLYKSPEIKVIEVKVQNILCGSNDPMREKDFGDGGFGNG